MLERDDVVIGAVHEIDATAYAREVRRRIELGGDRGGVHQRRFDERPRTGIETDADPIERANRGGGPPRELPPDREVAARPEPHAAPPAHHRPPPPRFGLPPPWRSRRAGVRPGEQPHPVG